MLRQQLAPERPKKALMDRIERLYGEAVAVKNAIVSANLRLVVSVAARCVGPASALFDLVSDGNVSLMRAVENFDYAWGARFRAYATRAIQATFARTIPAQRGSRRRCGAVVPATGNVNPSSWSPLSPRRDLVMEEPSHGRLQSS